MPQGKPKRKQDTCRCDRLPFPHRRDRNCDHLEALSDGRPGEVERQMQAEWDADRRADARYINAQRRGV